MMTPIFLEKILKLSYIKYSYAYYFCFNLLLLAFRSCLWCGNEKFPEILSISTIFLQILMLPFLAKIKHFLKKNYFLIHVYSVCVHITHIYFTSKENLDFFFGMETTIIIFVNFKEIRNIFLEILILGYAYVFFLKRLTNFDIDYLVLLYFVILLIIFEFTIKKGKVSTYEKKKSNDCEEEKKRINTLPTKNHDKSNNFSLYPQTSKSKVPSTRLIENNVTFEILNKLNQGLFMIDQDFNLIFSNKFCSEIFGTDDKTELKSFLFGLLENIDLNNSEDSKIPEIGLNKFFEKSIYLPESHGSSKMDEVSERCEFKKMLFEYSTSPDLEPNTQIPVKDKKQLNFKGWNKKVLSENLHQNSLDNFKNKANVKEPKSVFSYIQKFLVYFKEHNEKMSDTFSSKKNNIQEQQDFSLYVNLSQKNEIETSFLLNFVLLQKMEATNFESNPLYEILITMRELSDVEKKSKENLKGRDKELGTFCHELRTPINGLINMLDLMHSHVEVILSLDENLGLEIEELLSSAVITSNLLLNQIDDFIDYFSFFNKMIELHVGPFDIHSIMKETFRIFSNVVMKKNINFSIEIDSNIPTIIYNDSQKLRRIIYNLINNSIRYTDSGGVIKICAKLRKLNYIRISVFDTGSGIKTEDFQFLGKINNNITNSHKTTCGFGLFICNILSLLIEKEGPEKKKGLTVYSEQGVGTCFSFSFRNDMNWETRKIIDKKIACSSISIENKEIKDQIILSISSSECIGEKLFVFNSKEKISLSPTGTPTDLKNYRRISSSQLHEKNLIKISHSNKTEHLISSQICKRQPIQKTKNDLKSIKNLNRASSEVAKTELCSFNFRHMKECNCVKVLVVDDVPFNIQACSRLLEKMEIMSDSANNGQDAVEKVEELLGSILEYESGSSNDEKWRNSKENKFCSKCKFYKLILMDVDMPIKNGIEATEEIKNLLKNVDVSVSIVGLSAFDQENIVKRGKEAGMCEYITKPINAAKMKEIILKYVLN